MVRGSSCVFPRRPGHKMWLVEDGVAREAPELWPERASAAEVRSGGGWASNVAYMRRKGLVDTVHFSGEYPGALFAEALEPCQVQDGAQREVQFHADGWKEPSSRPDRVRLKPRPPRALYPALASAPGESLGSHTSGRYLDRLRNAMRSRGYILAKRSKIN